MAKRGSIYVLAGLAFGIADWYVLEGLGLFSQSGLGEDAAPPHQ